jgi:hypothetical protein
MVCLRHIRVYILHKKDTEDDDDNDNDDNNYNNNNNEQMHYSIYCVFSTDLLLQVSWSLCELPEDGDYTETCSSNLVLNT